MHSIHRRSPGATRTGFAPRTGKGTARQTRLPKSLFGMLSVFIVAACGDDPTAPIVPISIVTPSLAEAIEGVAYDQRLDAAGGSGPYSWLLAAGSLPAGFTLAPSGAISGVPVAPGTSSFRIRATDAGGRTATADLTISVVQALALHTGTLPDGVVDSAYSVQLQAVGGRGTRTWSVTGGEAASWLSVSSAGQLSGAPPASGASTVTVAVADESGQQTTRNFGIVVLDPVGVAEITLPTVTQGRVYATQLVATGGDGVYTWGLAGGVLPAGISLGPAGNLTGTSGEAGTFTFTARVVDRGNRSATRTLTLRVEPAPTIQTTSLPPGVPGVPYAAQLVATGGSTATYSWRVTDGALPGGLALTATGSLSGTPVALGGATFTVQVMDGAGATHSRAFTMVVAPVETLVNGNTVTGIEGQAGQVRYFSIEVPSGASQLIVTISGGTGDADLYVRRGGLPAQFVYDCRPFREGNEEVCTFTSPFLTAGHWYIMLRGHKDYAGVSLVANHDG
ncbi:MAG: hypothetical protein EA350_12770 [Gemmatimonadales bacterium]|nr:MAG: hypothetical protein EA350_12770 [Gemmatimonadales bacterium]